MAEKIRTVVMGASGRMGQMLVSSLADHPRLTLTGAVVHEGHAWRPDIGTAMGARHAALRSPAMRWRRLPARKPSSISPCPPSPSQRQRWPRRPVRACDRHNGDEVIAC